MWTAHPNNKGYGVIASGGRFGKPLLAHRVSWEIHYGRIPEGYDVLHSCDNPLCVRPDHLFLGTQLDNLKDMRRKGRGRNPPLHRGEDHHQAKLTIAKVLFARSVYDKGKISLKALAEQNGVSVSTMQDAISGKTWRE